MDHQLRSRDCQRIIESSQMNTLIGTSPLCPDARQLTSSDAQYIRFHIHLRFLRLALQSVLELLRKSQLPPRDLAVPYLKIRPHSIYIFPEVVEAPGSRTQIP